MVAARVRGSKPPSPSRALQTVDIEQITERESRNKQRETQMSGVKAGIMVSNQQFEGVDMVSALEEQIVMVRLARDRGWDSSSPGSTT
jgi:hypothetical protein